MSYNMLGDNNNKFFGRSMKTTSLSEKYWRAVCRRTPGIRYKDGCDKGREVELLQAGIGTGANAFSVRMNMI